MREYPDCKIKTVKKSQFEKSFNTFLSHFTAFFLKIVDFHKILQLYCHPIANSCSQIRFSDNSKFSPKMKRHRLVARSFSFPQNEAEATAKKCTLFDEGLWLFVVVSCCLLLLFVVVVCCC